MAFQRLRDKQTIATNLDAYISNQLFLVRQQRQTFNIAEESKFNQSVLEDNLSLQQQLDWRKKQLKNIPTGDRDERKRVREEISTLKDLMEQDEYNNKYLDQLTSMNSGVQSVDTTLSWLKNRLGRTTDPKIQKDIRNEINSLEKEKFTQQQNMISNQTTYASGSQDIDIISKQITKVNNSRVEALNAGLDEYVSLLDLQLQTLNKSLAEANIQKTVTSFSVATATGQSALALLDAMNQQVSSSDSNAPVTIGGTKYDSAQQYWQVQRNEYLNDRSANGFFPRYQTELAEQVDYKESTKQLTNQTLKDADSWYTSLKDRPELTDYSERIDLERQKTMQYTADKRAAQVLNRFGENLDTQTAINDLAYIQDQFNVDQTANYQQIIQKASSEKEAQVNDLLSTMRQILSQNPGMSNQDALQKAIQSGAGIVVSPEELATSKATDIINKFSDTATNEEAQATSQLDITKESTKSFGEPTEFKEGDYYKTPDSTTVYKYESGKLRPFTGAFSEEDFKSATGQGFNVIKTVSDVKNVSMGDAITKGDRLVQTQPQQETQQQQPDNTLGQYIPDPGLLQYYNEDQLIRRESKVYLKPGVDPVWKQQIKQDERANYTDDQIIDTGSNTYLKK